MSEEVEGAVLQVLDAAAIRRWADASVDLLEAHRGELDRMNVFPVPDGDTGTNLVATLRAGAEELVRRHGPHGTAAEVTAALAYGTLRGARGNSGVIVSQLLRGLAEVAAERPLDGAGLADALSRADGLARAAVSTPVEGTVLSVLRAAAGTARDASTLADVVVTVAEGAAKALADTPRQLPVLARADVVDAGGHGLVLILDALVGVVTGHAPVTVPDEPASRHHPRDRAALLGEREAGSAEFDYEVMYLLDRCSADGVEVLRARLGELGDSVVVVGSADLPGDDGGLWNVHVHCTDVGAAVEAGIEAGHPHRITVVRFADQPAASDAGRFARSRGVVIVVSGEPIVELVRADGVTALVARDGRAPSTGEIAAAIAGTRAENVVVLPNDVELTPVAEEAADRARTAGQEVVVVPTSSVLQGLAALAVHDGQRRAGDDVVAMAEAAAATRTGVVRIATGDALTWVGRCSAGDVLGLVDGEVVLIEQDLAAGACLLADRMLTIGGELVTVLLGEDADDALGQQLADHLRHSHPEVDVVRYRGGPAGLPLQLGVE
ncbi:DAK2 domain-containing protein [Pseudonocardia spinosispora]|uniref:DAK2 domain-containing protein n=1 Tax=Pseudonocardia spinosispora TaxID=103441 RepID=UPI001FE1AC82|nr:DAK2 domain-containing protein [Pseudonocardia spinosispora]